MIQLSHRREIQLRQGWLPERRRSSWNAYAWPDLQMQRATIQPAPRREIQPQQRWLPERRRSSWNACAWPDLLTVLPLPPVLDFAPPM